MRPCFLEFTSSARRDPFIYVMFVKERLLLATAADLARAEFAKVVRPESHELPDGPRMVGAQHPVVRPNVNAY